MCEDQNKDLRALQDTLYVLSGKWKLLILNSVCSGGHKRFREIERSIPNISTKMLAKELKEMEMNKLLKRTVYDESPVLVEYTATPYCLTLAPILQSMIDWGKIHSKVIREK